MLNKVFCFILFKYLLCNFKKIKFATDFIWPRVNTCFKIKWGGKLR